MSSNRPSYEDLERRVRVLEELLAQRSGLLPEPGEERHADTETIRFEDLFDLDDIQKLQDEFAAATGVGSIITRPDGEAITRPSRFCRLCRDIIRPNAKGMEVCRLSDAAITAFDKDKPIVTRCQNVGFWDAGASISVDGRHLANWLIGQVRDGSQDDAEIRAFAREIGVDEDAAAQAFSEVPIMSEQQFRSVSQALHTLANQLSETAYRNVQQTRFIAETVSMEQSRRRSEALHRTLVEAIPDLVWLKDPDGVYLSCNQAFESFFGATEAEILGKTDHDFVDAELADFFRRNDLKALEADGPRMNEEWLTFAVGGYEGLFETIKAPMRDADGNLIGVLGIGRDVTGRHRAEEELRESEERYRSLHNASFGGIAIHDQGVILLCNQGLADLTGYGVDELMGMNGLLLIAESARDMVIAKIRAGAEDPYEAVGVRKNGEEYPLRLEARNVPYKGKIVRTVEFRDISELKLAEENQQRLQDQLHQAQKMESVGQLAGGIAHDFNNLLQVILGYGQIVVETTGEDDANHSCVQQMMKAGNRARTLVAQLLAFSRRQVLQLRVLDLNEAVSEQLNILQRVIGEHVSVTFHAGDALEPVQADSGRVGQILTNLCVNARDAMPEGGAITISTSMVDRSQVNLGDREGDIPPRFVRLSVVDTGCGMDRAVLEQAFEPFFTTKDVGAGTGLGLATVYGLVTQHHGHVAVESTVGEGTSFHVDLPPAVAAVESVKHHPEIEVMGGSETILLAEDDAMVRQLTTILLERAGYTVLQAHDGDSALALFESHSDDVDLVLLDVVMPSLGGRAVYDRIRQQRPDIPAIFASGYSMDAIHTDFVLNEGLVLIQKPTERDDLLRTVRDVLDGAGTG